LCTSSDSSRRRAICFPIRRPCCTRCLIQRDIGQLSNGMPASSFGSVTGWWFRARCCWPVCMLRWVRRAKGYGMELAFARRWLHLHLHWPDTSLSICSRRSISTGTCASHWIDCFCKSGRARSFWFFCPSIAETSAFQQPRSNVNRYLLRTNAQRNAHSLHMIARNRLKMNKRSAQTGNSRACRRLLSLDLGSKP